MELEIILNKENMYGFFRQTKEFIFIDEAKIIPGESAKGMKKLDKDEWYFKYHFPNQPVMPGVFQMEAIMQTAGLIINTMQGKKELTLMFSEAKNIKIYSSVRPGDELHIDVKLKSYKRGIAWFEGKVTVKEKVTCKMEVSLLVTEELIKMRG